MNAPLEHTTRVGNKYTLYGSIRTESFLVTNLATFGSSLAWRSAPTQSIILLEYLCMQSINCPCIPSTLHTYNVGASHQFGASSVQYNPRLALGRAAREVGQLNYKLKSPHVLLHVLYNENGVYCECMPYQVVKGRSESYRLPIKQSSAPGKNTPCRFLRHRPSSRYSHFFLTLYSDFPA